MLDLNDVLSNVTNWVTEVGMIQLGKAAGSINYQTKSTAIDLVTEVDFLSEKILLEKIIALYPGHNIITEESGEINNNSEYTWIIDPLDGTNNYFHAYPIFCISIALKYRNVTVLGVIYVPRLGEMFYAIRGQGAYLNGVKISVSNNDRLKMCLLATGFPYDKAVDIFNNNMSIFNNIVKEIMGIRRSGSAAFDLCCTACGRLDGYWELKLKRWDIEAGALIVKEAGGRIIISEKEKGINIIAGNKKVVSLIQESISSCYQNF